MSNAPDLNRPHQAKGGVVIDLMTYPVLRLRLAGCRWRSEISGAALTQHNPSPQIMHASGCAQQSDCPNPSATPSMACRTPRGLCPWLSVYASSLRCKSARFHLSISMVTLIILILGLLASQSSATAALPSSASSSTAVAAFRYFIYEFEQALRHECGYTGDYP